ncbi:MAG: hypothetical protein GX808_05440 [Syntrophomonadaceae bacterium]|jgi:uncharacterized membrane protein|nr:hypothetical protein [Syntrophomonadaceae bacterium]
MRKMTPYTLTAIGLILLAAGLYMIKTVSAPEGMMLALPYVCVGLGCGMFGHGVGEIFNHSALKNSPDLAKQIEIDKKDERNVTIANRAKGKAFDVMVPLLGALMISFALMGVDIIAVLLLVAAYLFIYGCSIYYRIRYENEM